MSWNKTIIYYFSITINSTTCPFWVDKIIRNIYILENLDKDQQNALVSGMYKTNDRSFHISDKHFQLFFLPWPLLSLGCGFLLFSNFWWLLVILLFFMIITSTTSIIPMTIMIIWYCIHFRECTRTGRDWLMIFHQ